MFADKFDKTASAKVGLLKVVIASIYLKELLGMLISDRNHQSPARL